MSERVRTTAAERGSERELRGRGEGSSLGFELDDDAWMSVVRESVAAREMGEFAGYRLLEEIGRGAQGAVFKAVQPGTGRMVAIKHVSAGPLAGTSALERFEREVRVLSGLRHAGIVGVYGVIESGPHTALVMEFVDGVAIDVWAQGATVRARVEAMAKVADAVSHAHHRGVIHRDIKPSNVMVDAEGQPRVLDFGLAALMAGGQAERSWLGAGAAGVSRAGFVGTPEFASPEQLKGGAEALDTRSDVYSLGVLLGLVLTGVMPGSHGGGGKGVARDLWAIAGMATREEPSLRYQSADAMGADLRRWLAGEPVHAHAPTLAYRAAKFMRKRPVLCAVVGGGIVGIAGLAVVSTVLALRLEARSVDLTAALKQAGESGEEARAQAARAQVLAQAMRETLRSVSESVAESAPGSVFLVTQDVVARIEQMDAQRDPALVESLWYDVGRVASRLNDVVVSEKSVGCGMPMAEELYGKESPQYGRWLTLDGIARERRQELPEAARCYRDAYQTLLRTVGPADADTGHAAHNYATMLGAMGHNDEAELAFMDAIIIRIAAHGERSDFVASSLKGLGGVALARKDFALAHKYLDMAMATFPANTAVTNPYRLSTITVRVRALRDEGRMDEAIALTTETITMIAATTDPRSPKFGKFYELRSRLYRRQGRHAEALADQEAFNATALMVPVDHPAHTSRVVATARMLVSLERFDEATAKIVAAQKELELAGKAGTDAGKKLEAAIAETERARARAAKKAAKEGAK